MITDLLLATGLVDPNLADNDGNSPLIYTVSLGKSTRKCLDGSDWQFGLLQIDEEPFIDVRQLLFLI